MMTLSVVSLSVLPIKNLYKHAAEFVPIFPSSHHRRGEELGSGLICLGCDKVREPERLGDKMQH